MNSNEDSLPDQHTPEPSAVDSYAADLLAWPASPPDPGAPPDSAADALDSNPRFRRVRAFRSRFLPGERDLSVYLPAAYFTEPTRHFPVMYLHDGQNLFDGRRSFVPGHTWRAHTTADELAAAGSIEPLILVGVDHGGVRRTAEYTSTPDPRQGGGEAARYARMLIEEIMPLIERALRTLAGPEHTGTGGSSLGGLVSLWLGLRFPQVFGRVAALSPSLWWNGGAIAAAVAGSPSVRQPELHSSGGAEIAGRPARPRLWIDMGSREGEAHVREAERLCRRLLAAGWKQADSLRPPREDHGLLHFRTVEDGHHNEDAWAARFGDVLQFLFPFQP